MKATVRSLLLLSMLALSGAALADTLLGESCDLSILGVTDKNEFLRFDAMLRQALDRQDAEALAALTQFPLRVNFSGSRHISISNAAALRKRLLTPYGERLRPVVMGQKPEAVFCKADGAMYGNGVIWTAPVVTGKTTQFRITAVNVPAPAPRQGAPAAGGSNRR